MIKQLDEEYDEAGIARGTHETIASIDYAPPDLSLSPRDWWIIGWLGLLAWGVLAIVMMVCRALVGTW